MSRNSFRDLQEEAERNFDNGSDRGVEADIRNEVWQTLGVFKFIGQIVEMYLPNVLNTFIGSLGGEKIEWDKEKFSDAPSLGGINDPSGPGSPDDAA